uniref:G-protein coupled receptors family 1 profile domain-containing protein n=1 Tax=Oryzias sinensis TaxID=183150 RepID=A0A8C7X399_9TELE
AWPHIPSSLCLCAFPLAYRLSQPQPNNSAIFSALGLTSNLIAVIVLIKSCQRTQSRSRSFFLIFLGGLVVTDFMGLLVTGSVVISFYVNHIDWRQSDLGCH